MEDVGLEMEWEDDRERGRETDKGEEVAREER
jgi:hypothetical protein